MAEQPPSQAVTVEFSKDSCNTASEIVESQPYFPIASGRGVAHIFDSFSP